MNTITHPLVKPGLLERREYQFSIAVGALERNTMVVLPTGLGKTAVALLVAASRLYNAGGKVLMLAPTKPLVEQHLRYFRDLLVSEFPSKEPLSCVMFTGETPPEERERAWKDASFLVATPQVVKNDLIAGRYRLSDVSLLIVDECHRAVGDYSYVFLAAEYMQTAAHPLILAMTASPGGNAGKVAEIAANLSIDRVETRSEDDPDVRPYVHEREIEVVNVPLPREISLALDDLGRLLDARIARLQQLGFAVPKRQHLSMKALSALNGEIQERIQARDPSGFAAASVYAECMKLRHAVSLAESQGSRVLAAYLGKLAREGGTASGSKASQRLAQDEVFRALLGRVTEWSGEIHTKLPITVEIVRAQLDAYPESRIIVFATYRDTVQQITDRLLSAGIPTERFVGQATKDSEKGLSQKKQLEALGRFRAGTSRVLVATSVGEEGLDIPATDLVVFYEAVPSEIRSIQRKGRTGRSGAGKIVILVTKGTSDEVYRFVSQFRERSMRAGIRQMSAFSPAAGRVTGAGGDLDLPAGSPVPNPAGGNLIDAGAGESRMDTARNTAISMQTGSAGASDGAITEGTAANGLSRDRILQGTAEKGTPANPIPPGTAAPGISTGPASPGGISTVQASPGTAPDGKPTGLLAPGTAHAKISSWDRPGQPVADPFGQSRIDAFVPAEKPVDHQVPVIVADDRETGSRVVEELHRMGISLRLKRLSNGDYAIGDRVLVERKTVRDFVDTLVERDLLAQLRELADAVPRPVIIIEGDKDLYAQRDVHPNAIRGTLAAIAIDLGIGVFRSSGPEDTAGILAVIARRESGSSREPRLPIRKPGLSPRARAEQVIATYPEIGLRQARILLDHFGSVKGVVDADEDALRQVPGIGEKRAKQIAALSRHPYREDRRKEPPDS